MNKKGGAVLASKTGFYIVFLILFTLAVGYSLKFIEGGEVRRVDFLDLEKSVIANRVLSCLSKENFGDIDDVKLLDTNGLRNCLDNDIYNIFIILNKDGDAGGTASLGTISFDAVQENRFVVVDGEKARLEVWFSKNVGN